MASEIDMITVQFSNFTCFNDWMIKIVTATIQDVAELTTLAKTTFIQSHGHSAPEKDIKKYMAVHFTIKCFQKELENPDNYYRLLFYNGNLAGYSKIIFNQSIKTVQKQNISKLERIYLLKDYLGLSLGEALLDFNVVLAKEHQQAGIWLYTWVENKRAIGFYQKKNFEIVGRHDFKISETHVNPNHQFYLPF